VHFLAQRSTAASFSIAPASRTSRHQYVVLGRLVTPT